LTPKQRPIEEDRKVGHQLRERNYRSDFKGWTERTQERVGCDQDGPTHTKLNDCSANSGVCRVWGEPPEFDEVKVSIAAVENEINR
jgi:hypothetical protein